MNEPWAKVLCNLGVARTRCGKLAAGLEALEQSLEIDPYNTRSLRMAAACANELGDKPKGRRYQKLAIFFGGFRGQGNQEDD